MKQNEVAICGLIVSIFLVEPLKKLEISHLAFYSDGVKVTDEWETRKHYFFR